jgi:ribonuclease HI
MKHVELFCDGACSGNPGPGGWGAVLRFQDQERELSGAEAATTNNQMELLACISGLEALKEGCEVLVWTDSQYLAKAFQDGWLEKWQRNGWKTSGKQPVKNRDLWERLLVQAKRHTLRWRWIKGHAGHAGNERADRLAVAAREALSGAR